MLKPVIALLSTALLAAAASNPLTSTGCADPSGLQTCQNAANQKTSACIAQANKDGSQQEILACGCQDYVNNFNCYATHCWNRVWECEYQEYIISYLTNCPIGKLPVPYFPAPDNAADACSCNLGKVFLAVQDSILEAAACTNNANGPDPGTNLQVIEGCNCCEISGGLSSLFEICPKTDPKIIGLSNISQRSQELSVDFSKCGSYMSQYNCINDLHYSVTGVSTFYAPDDPVTTGTETLSNVPGTVTAPPSGAVFSYTNGGDKAVYTISAAGVKKGGKDSGPTPAVSENNGDATESGNAKETGSSKNEGAALEVGKYFVAIAVSVSIFAF
ncbi:hypothetical protein PT974_05254 [Cladobotryum mycophilum]|uniref:Uncharacterized protein n=1 Tax=Cladobotryum mycophilum TaxID=491253 RepID=A0ABR0SI90_9HYPO